MRLTNTSGTRILAKHTVMNAPLITHWLKSCIQEDITAQRLGFEFLGALGRHQMLVHALTPNRAQTNKYIRVVVALFLQLLLIDCLPQTLT